ncbi:MAG: precorrin-3B C(17)-methyltransferase [Theionarchaea archaeon]|nr:MAG: hypothetical protein AYK18_04790 [Theionarchaea archaeon DG-70]MBU7010001.1 precorrin-3B C(17)-methyltransferase [Theionarchaea archaeon]
MNLNNGCVSQQNTRYVAVVGLGFCEHHITLEAIQELKRAEVVLGHESVISSLSEYIPGDAMCISDAHIRERTDDIKDLRIYRTKEAVKYALKGKRVVYLCPGDPGIYSYAQPILEYAAEKVEVKVVPGITAALVAAARLGAPLRDGFALIGLYEERLNPEIIEKRVRAAIESDFVIVFYLPKHEALLYPQFYPEEKYPELYPVKVRCVERLENAFCILQKTRSPDTPLGILRISQEQEVILTTLNNYSHVFEDILPYSTVVVGNSMSKIAGKYFVTSVWRD